MTAMTALQDWLSFRPVDPETVKAFIRDAIRNVTGDDQSAVPEPRLISRGVERC